ncbi:hypothetical protein CEK27_009315 [Fusarium fujikuroi]|uniref:Zinc cluster transcription factor n=1 Tax=Fusarium fujikuroi TaxID=5127 RepID=A0A9Q9S120_FUSFU|nr:hypothetical protein CEK27_009315 [Fusarium fujikuroi]VTT83056.1 unnamed protein product [Fusarium fujikuroi]VZH92604.1 unnamed protein product [Fusarium fujikuroi]
MARCRRTSSRESLEEDTASAGRSLTQPCHAFKRRSARTAPRYAHGSMKEPMTDKAHQKVRKACVRCRMKKTKLVPEEPLPSSMLLEGRRYASHSPYGHITDIRYRYAEVLEQSQYILIETVFKLYGMVRNSQSWKLAEPHLNEHGQPVAQHITKLLGCVPPNSDIGLPVRSIFPEDVDSLEELYHELEEHERSEAASTPSLARGKELTCDESAMSEPQDSDIEPPYHWADCQTQGTVDLLPQTRSNGLDIEGAVAADMYGNALFSDTPPSPLAWNSYIDGHSDSTMCPPQHVGVMQGNGMFQQDLLRPIFEGVEPYSMSVDLGMRYRDNGL